MKRLALILSVLLPVATAQAGQWTNAPHPVPVPPTETLRACIASASALHSVPEVLVFLILRVEGGRLGRIVPNASGAPPDIGPMQVNAMHVARIAARWGTDPQTAFLALRDNFCANVEAGAWILRQAMDRNSERFWEGVLYYHSATPEFRVRYRRLLRDQARRLGLLPAAG